MIIRIELDETVNEDEVLIRCKQIDDNIKKIQKLVSNIKNQPKLHFFKDNTEYYLPLDKVLFFETSGGTIYAHTSDNMYSVKNKLYELEEFLPENFIRVSKSTILNVMHIYSIEKNITSSSLVQFNSTHKQVFVSRNYYKALRQRIDEKRKL